MFENETFLVPFQPLCCNIFSICGFSRLILSFFSFALHNACSGDFGCLVYVMLTLNTKYFDVCLFFDIPATFTLWKIGIFSWHVPLPNLSEDTESVFSVSKTSVCCLSAVLSTRPTSDSQCLSCQTAKPGHYASNKCPNEIPESTSAKWIQVPKVLVYYSMYRWYRVGLGFCLPISW